MFFNWIRRLVIKLVGIIRRAWGVPRIPGKVKCVHLMKENSMGLIYNAFLPEVVDVDVVKSVLKVSVDGVETLVDVEKGKTFVELAPVKDGALVGLSVQSVDDAGNVSDWSDVFEFTAVDTIIPVKPGMVSVKLIAEVADPAPEPEPTPEPTPEPAPEPTPEVPVDPAPEVPVDPAPPVVE